MSDGSFGAMTWIHYGFIRQYQQLGENVAEQMEGLDYFCQTKLDTIITPESSDTLQGFNIIVWRTLWRFHLFQLVWSASGQILSLLRIAPAEYYRGFRRTDRG